MKKKSGFNTSMSHRQVVMRCLPIIVSDRMVHERSENGRPRIEAFRGDRSLFYNSGFTLIELLVVVLIIGILAAVALPQYKLAVAKARMTQLITFGNTVKQAQQRYHLANGIYATNWDELDIDLTGYVTRNHMLYKGELDNEKDPYGVLNYQDKGLYFYGGTDYLPGILLIVFNALTQRSCYADKTNSQAMNVCRHVCNSKNLTIDGSWKYCSF